MNLNSFKNAKFEEYMIYICKISTVKLNMWWVHPNKIQEILRIHF